MTSKNLILPFKNECPPELYLKIVCTALTHTHTHTHTHTLKQLMLCSELIAVCYEPYTIHKYTVWAELKVFNVKTCGTESKHGALKG